MSAKFKGQGGNPSTTGNSSGGGRTNGSRPGSSQKK